LSQIQNNQAFPVPVMSGRGPRCYEWANRERLLCLIQAPNVKVIRRRKDKMIVELQVRECGDDSALPDRKGNPRAYSHDHETDQNPPRCWTLRRLRKAS
jgi:hypothetical protein